MNIQDEPSFHAPTEELGHLCQEFALHYSLKEKLQSSRINLSTFAPYPPEGSELKNMHLLSSLARRLFGLMWQNERRLLCNRQKYNCLPLSERQTVAPMEEHS